MAGESRIRENMEVYSSDGELVGQVASSGPERLSVKTAGAAGQRDIPADWISHIDGDVHLRHGASVVRARLAGKEEPAPHATEGRLTGPWVIGGIFLVILIALLIWGLIGYR